MHNRSNKKTQRSINSKQGDCKKDKLIDLIRYTRLST